MSFLMNKMKLKIIFIVLSVLFSCDNFVLCDGNLEDRKLSYEINPGCVDVLGSTCDGLTFVHITAEGASDQIHYVYDFTGTPSFFVAKTDKNSILGIDWNSFMGGNANSVNFSSSPDYVFAAVIKRVLTFNDPNDLGNINDESVKEVTAYSSHKFNWTRATVNQTEDRVMLVMNSSVGKNGSFAVKLSAFGSSKHGDDLPHLYHSAHSMQIDLIAKNFLSNYTSPRIALELLIVSSENKTEGSFHVNKRRNLDDEFTPGIFDVYNIVSPRSTNDSRGAFLQYRPVCYTTKDRTVSGSTELKQGAIQNFINNEKEIEMFTYTLPYSYYGYKLSSIIAQGTNITFGMTGDGFYSRTNYISFSLLMGMGEPPIEKLSNFVITFAAIGLGIPMLVFLIGGCYVGIKRYRN